MRSILYFLLLLPFAGAAQDCAIKRQTDPYTKITTLTTGFIQLKGGSVSIDASKDDIDMLFSIQGSDRCFTDASQAYIYFVGVKSKQMQKNGGSMNCEGLFHFIFKNNTTPVTLLKKLSTQKVEKIVFIGNDKKEIPVLFDDAQAQQFMNLAGCILQEAPALKTQ